MTAITPWADHAACHDFPELFYPEDLADQEEQQSALKAAKAVCGACPVLQECALWALTRPEVFGIWGGMTARERTRIRHRYGQYGRGATRDVKPCGTSAAIRRHQRRKEPLCRACAQHSAQTWANKKAAA